MKMKIIVLFFFSFISCQNSRIYQALGKAAVIAKLIENSTSANSCSEEGKIRSCNQGQGIQTCKNSSWTECSISNSNNSTPTSTTYTIGGTVSGLSSTVVLQNNSGDNITLSSNGTFSFPTKVKDYKVTVLTQPTHQTCNVTSGSGAANSDVNNISVTCSENPKYVVSVTVSGLVGSVTLQNNSTDDSTVSTNGSFNFTKSLFSKEAYSVTVLTQPANQTCTSVNSTGNIDSGNVNVAFTCAYNAPSSISYNTNNAVYTVNSSIIANAPTVVGNVTSFSITPSVSLIGLSFSTTTGTISGVPDKSNPETSYTVTALNSTGSATTTIKIRVVAQGQPTSAPVSVSYLTSNASYKVGLDITQNIPTVNGIATSFTITPNLPEGLSFNTTTGVISGKPTWASPLTSYTINAINEFGSVETKINITVESGYHCSCSKLIYPPNSSSAGLTPVDMVSDSHSNVYIVGHYDGTYSSTDSNGELILKSTISGSTDIFIIKMNSDCTHAWTKYIQGSGGESVKKVLIDSKDNLYIVGNYGKNLNGYTINFASDFGETDIKSYKGSHSVFITKINSNATYGWTKIITPSSGGYILVNSAKIYLDQLYLIGTFNGTVNFGEDFSITGSRNGIYYDVFITKINTNSSSLYEWTKTIQNPDTSLQGLSIEIDSAENIYILGYIENSSKNVNFAQDFGGTDNKKAYSYRDIFLTKINKNLKYQWTKIFIGMGDTETPGIIEKDTYDNIYILASIWDGSYNYASDFGGFDTIAVTLNGADLTLTKINSTGFYDWTKAIRRTPGIRDGASLYIDNSNNFYIGYAFRKGVRDIGEFFTGGSQITTPNTNGAITKINSNIGHESTKLIGNSSSFILIKKVIKDKLGHLYYLGTWNTGAQSSLNFAESYGDSDIKKVPRATVYTFFGKVEQ